MISYEEARGHILGRCLPLAPVRLPVAESIGLVTAEPVISAEAVPPVANTAMDGFAVRSADTVGATGDSPVRLRIAGTIRAGQAPEVTVGPGDAVRIMTGAPLPRGADSVVMVERTRTTGPGADDVEVDVEVPPGLHIRPAGDDIVVGDVVFPAGEELRSGHAGVLASIGAVDVAVHPRLRVGVFSTGDELIPAGQPLGAGQIHDSNRITLLSLVRGAGYDAVDLGLIPDDDARITAAIVDGVRRCDALITSGGVSMGDFDLVKVVLDRIGDMRWMQVAIRPAKPLAFGTVSGGSVVDGSLVDVPVFGLPGNPVSSVVSFELFARPALRRMAGVADDRLDVNRRPAVAVSDLRRRPDGKVHFVRVVGEWSMVSGQFEIRSAGEQGSHQLTALARANALAVLPDGHGIAAGEAVEVLVLP